MKLDEYVKQTLLDITSGVSAARNESALWIAPAYIGEEKVYAAQMVNFDIAVTVSKEAGGGIQVWSFGDIKAQGTSETVNKISFAVPVYFQAPKTNEAS